MRRAGSTTLGGLEHYDPFQWLTQCFDTALSCGWPRRGRIRPAVEFTADLGGDQGCQRGSAATSSSLTRTLTVIRTKIQPPVVLVVRALFIVELRGDAQDVVPLT